MKDVEQARERGRYAPHPVLQRRMKCGGHRLYFSARNAEASGQDAPAGYHAENLVESPVGSVAVQTEIGRDGPDEVEAETIVRLSDIERQPGGCQACDQSA